MRNAWFILPLVLMVSLLANCQPPTQENQKLTPQEFEAKMMAMKNHTLLDVRTQEEYAKGHLAEATLIDFYDNDFKKQLAKLDKAKPVFVYCAVGGRSGAAANTLVQLGFKQVYDLKGGIQSWVQAQKKVVK